MALIGSAIAGSAQGAKVEGKAIVRTVKGTAQYLEGDKWLEAKPNAELSPGTTLRTGPASYVYVSVNGLTSALRLNSETTLGLQIMTRTGAGATAATETMLDLKSGTIVGQVKKITGDSLYEIKTPQGLMGIRGTDFMIEAEPKPDGSFRVTYSCIAGAVVCAVMLKGQLATRVLNAGESWTLGDEGNKQLRPPGINGTNAPPVSLSHGEMQGVKKLAADYNSFGFQLLKATSKANPKTNIFLSPLGAAFALAIARSGARGDTQKEITSALRLETWPTSGIDEANKKMFDYLSTLGGSLRLEIANGLWTDQKAPIKPGFVANAREFYNGEARSVNLCDPAAVGEINGWVNDRTHGTIPSIVGYLDPLTVMVLVDAVYFKALWAGPFDKELTKDKPFKLALGGKISHPRMLKSGSFNYYETHSFQMAALPYQGSATMYVSLPKGSLQDFAQRLTLQDWEKWISHLEIKQGTLELPRFKLDNDYDLVGPLKDMGIRMAFKKGTADFGGVADLPSWIGQAEQKTYVDVNEEGTEAAAVTMFDTVSIGIAKPHKEPPPFEMIVDHPFFVVIRENLTGAILFMGAIMDPR
jgi:serpin B